MPVTLKCPECRHSVQAEDDTLRTCPMCDGTMKKPAYKAKSGSTSSDREKAKAKAQEEPLPLDDEDEPKPKKAKSANAEKGAGGNTRDGRAAESLDIDAGFKDQERVDAAGGQNRGRTSLLLAPFSRTRS